MSRSNPPGVDGSPVKAAGGLITRRGADGLVQFVVVHRPHYDDWTLPKGKRKRGESARGCALREVDEETNLRCVAHEELPRTAYVMPDGRTKVVRWWHMTVVEDLGFRPDSEVDQIRWVDVAVADEALTFADDVTVVRSLGEFTCC